MKSSCNSDSAQQQPLDLVSASRYWPRARAPRRDAILALLDCSVNWAAIEADIRPHYAADIQRRGRRGYSLRLMIRVAALAWLWGASDRNMENALMDSKAMARFAGLDPWAPRPPSASAIGAFRHLLQGAIGPDGVFSLYEHLIDVARAGIVAAGLEFRPGNLTEPLFRRAARPIMRPAPAIDSEGEAQ